MVGRLWRGVSAGPIDAGLLPGLLAKAVDDLSLPRSIRRTAQPVVENRKLDVRLDPIWGGCSDPFELGDRLAHFSEGRMN
jgi:hypothetical protein